jgi:transposase
MANITKVELQKSIISLFEQGWSERRIARELDVHRATVKRYVGASKCTNAQTGKQGPVSICEPYRERVLEWFESGLSIERIHHDLALGHGFDGSYHSV